MHFHDTHWPKAELVVHGAIRYLDEFNAIAGTIVGS